MPHQVAELITYAAKSNGGAAPASPSGSQGGAAQGGDGKAK